MDANIIVILISLALFLAYISGMLFTLTRVPDMVWMIGFGILFGPVLGFFKSETITNLVPFVVVMALFGAIAGPVLYKDRPKPEMVTEPLNED